MTQSLSSRSTVGRGGKNTAFSSECKQARTNDSKNGILFHRRRSRRSFLTSCSAELYMNLRRALFAITMSAAIAGGTPATFAADAPKATPGVWKDVADATLPADFKLQG